MEDKHNNYIGAFTIIGLIFLGLSVWIFIILIGIDYKFTIFILLFLICFKLVSNAFKKVYRIVKNAEVKEKG